MDAMATCCRGDVVTKYKHEFMTQDQVLGLVNNYSLHFLFPVQKDTKSNKFLTYPFVPIGESSCSACQRGLCDFNVKDAIPNFLQMFILSKRIV